MNPRTLQKILVAAVAFMCMICLASCFDINTEFIFPETKISTGTSLLEEDIKKSDNTEV